jgi:O-antigen/teichoic acid export membrane protein
MFGTGLAVLGALVGWLVGADVVALLFGEEFMPDQTLAMLAAGGVMAAASAQVTSQVLVAEGRTGDSPGPGSAVSWLGSW